MRLATVLAAGACLLGLLPLEAQAQRIRLRYVQEGKKPKLTPLEQKYQLIEDDELQLPVGGKASIAVKPQAQSQLKIDTTGDGRLNRLLAEGDIVALRLRIENKQYPYAIRYVIDSYQRRCMTAACSYQGKIGGVRIAILDSNLNGKFNDYGEDMMVVGNLPYAYPLSKILVFGKRVFDIKVAENGQSIEYTRNTEKLQRVDFTSRFHGAKKPKMVVFRRDKGWSGQFVALRLGKGNYLPVDEWTFAYAVFSDKLWARGSDEQAPIELEKGPAQIEWGKPYHLVLAAEINDSGTKRTMTAAGVWQAPKLIETKVDGTHIKLEVPEIVGRGGERYIGNWRHADSWGVSLADPNIGLFTVKIRLDNRLVNSGRQRWMRLDMSGLVVKTKPFWVPYEWPTGKRKGTLKISVIGSSSRFGALSTKRPVEVEITD